MRKDLVDRKWNVPQDMAVKAARRSVAYVEEATGLQVDAEIKGHLIKAIAGTIQRLEVQGQYLCNDGFLRVAGSERAIHNAEKKGKAAVASNAKRKRWRISA